MLRSLNVRQMGIKQDMDTGYILKLANKYGFDAVCFDGLTTIPSKADLDYWGLYPGTMKLPINWRDSDDIEYLIGKNSNYIDRISGLGLKNMYTWLPYELGKESWGKFYTTIRHRLRLVSSFLESYGIRLAVEPICLYQSRMSKERVFISSYDGARALTNDIDNCELCLDTYHLWASGWTYGFIESLTQKEIPILHLSDPKFSDEIFTAVENDRSIPQRHGHSHQILERLGEDRLYGIVTVECFRWPPGNFTSFEPIVELIARSFVDVGVG